MSCVLIDNHLSSRLSYNMNKFDVQFPCYFRLSMLATSSHLTQFISVLFLQSLQILMSNGHNLIMSVLMTQKK